ncbi:hypothetical protein [Saccharopolyspora pogona]|uniref:hypothetical protein n=1 Tax=Saccharopolyspora pogona TaxID=333966 RepID=UPI001CC22741|nr:hypothetical protein [Saccharopolyspora pogona]
MVIKRLPRVQEIILPVLREQLPGVKCGSWVEAVDLRQFPLINVRRLGGLDKDLDFLGRATIELTAYTTVGLVETEDLFLDARQVIWNMVRDQTVTPAGYLHSFRETMGQTQFDSPYDDTWRIQGLIQLGVRPPRQT